MKESDLTALNERIQETSAFVEEIFEEIRKVIIGQKYMIERMIIGLLCNGHILLEGVPGLAKTTAVQALSSTIAVSFKRLQFTPDLLPADLIGTQIYNQRSGDFYVKKGPIFANLVLADEINRAPAKVQSALLEAMQERQVTIGDETYPLDPPFLVLATQNPIEQEGTYPLPEAQVDRFMLKLQVTYPSRTEELSILRQITREEPQPIQQVISPQEILQLRTTVREIYMDEKIENYIVDLVCATREPAKVPIGPTHRPHRIRRIAAGDDLPRNGCQSPRLPPSSRVCNARRCLRGGHGCPQTPRYRQLRSGGGRNLL